MNSDDFPVPKKGHINVITCLKMINDAFPQRPPPGAVPLYRSTGLDAGYVVHNWQGKTRRCVADPKNQLEGTAEDLDYMSWDWLFYFLPGLMERAVANPKRMDEEIVLRLIDILLNDQCSRSAGELFSRLSKPQLQAVHCWVTWVGINIKSFDFLDDECRSKIKSLRKGLAQ